jgi:cytochrome c biogenesis protein CcmG/thiol:disulfide interchange protein DsbE
MDRFMFWLQNPKRWFLLTAAVFLLGAGWIWFSVVPPSETTGGRVPSPREGFLAPDFTLTGTDGQPWTLAELRGNPVILNLWATWCPPCRAEMPTIQQVYESNRERGLVVFAVNTTYQDSADKAAAFAEEFELTFPILLDIDGTVSRQYQLRALPTTFFIDAQGVIQMVAVGGPMNATTLATGVESLFSEAR